MESFLEIEGSLFYGGVFMEEKEAFNIEEKNIEELRDYTEKEGE